VAAPQGFRPSLSPQQVKDFKRLYEQKPDQFNEQTVQAIQHHADYYKLPFAETDTSFAGKVGKVAFQAVRGFKEGFTTLKSGDPPVDDAEAIARNVGHLAGFVGYIPSGPFKLMGAHTLAGAAKNLKGISVPMLAAKYAEKGAKKIINPIYGKAIERRVKAGKDAVGLAGFLEQNIVKDIGQGAFHLGVASAVSSWQGGVDEMMDAFKHGAVAGGAFRVIGNAVNTGDAKADTMLKTLAGSLFTGLPSTVRGETTPMQIYQYLLGAYFGKNELPVHRKMAFKHLQKMKIGTKDEVLDPELIPGWDKIAEPGKDFVNKTIKERIDPVNNLAAWLMSETKGITPEEARTRAKEIIEAEKEATKVYIGEDGQPELNLTKKELKEIELSGEDVDPQNIPERLSLNAKSFVDRHMPVYLEGKSTGEKLAVAVNIDSKWRGLIKKARETGENPASEIIDYIKNKYPDFSISPDSKAFWTQQGFIRTKQSPVSMITVSNGIPRIMMTDSTGSAINDAGNRKMLSQEPKHIEWIYLNDYNKQRGDNLTRPEGVYAVLDHFTLNGREVELNKYSETLARRKAKQEDGNVEDYISYGDRVMNEELGRTMSYMNSSGEKILYTSGRKKGRPVLDKYGKPQYTSGDMYYYGGRGDASRLYFVKYHPSTPSTSSGIKKTMNDIKKEMRKIKVKNEKGKMVRLYSEADIKKIEKSKKEFIETYGEGIKDKKVAGEIFDRSFISNAIYDAKLNGFRGLEDIGKVLGKGFINDAKAFNKRAQIWFTSGYSSDPQALINTTKKARSKIGGNDIEGDSLNIKLIEDLADESAVMKIGDPNSKRFEGVDGFIYGRSDIIDGLNRQGGLPEEGGVNKSFIVSPDSQYGALLGKYMIHSVTPKMEKYMQDNNIHMIIPKSSAKQIGTRELGTLDWVKSAPKVTGETYKLPIRDIKVVMSEKTDSHYIKPQRMLKQLWTNFTPFSHFDKSKAPFKTEAEYNKVMDDILADMYEDMSGKKVKGVDEYNTLTEKLIADPIANEKNIQTLVDNMDSIGIHTLLKAVRSKGNEKFTNEVYRKVQKLNIDIIEQMRADGEYTDKQVETMKNEMANFEAVHERIVNLLPDSISGHLHKFNRDYRMSVIRNYIVNNVTRPTVGNSASSRMRPYEPGMRYEGPTKELEKRDDIFFLDNGHKELLVDVTGIGRKGSIKGKFEKLEDLWTEYKDGKEKDPQLKEVFRSLVVRTPMDSMSGAHVLNFRGFTGIRGFGSLLHGRTMEALGGADLDGDKAFVFFGGKSGDGTGSGFKKEWKDAYDWSRNEYVKDGKVEHNKSTIIPGEKELTFQEELTTQGEVKDEVGLPSSLQYSPMTRRKASSAASLGRDQLGNAVTQASYIKSAYASIRAAEGSKVMIPIKMWSGGQPITVNMEVTAKKDSKSLRTFRARARASVALASDPMDEAGLNFGRFGKRLMDKQLNTLFDFKVLDDRKTIKITSNDKKKVFFKKNPNYMKEDKYLTKRLKGIHRGSVVKSMRDVNQAIYSRNWAENRRFHMWEIQEKLDNLDSLDLGVPKENRNTFLPKLGTSLKNLDWSDGVLRRVDLKSLSEVYATHKKSLTGLDWLRDALGRDSMAVEDSAYVNLALKYNLHTKDGMSSQLNPNHTNFNSKLLDGKAFKAYNSRPNYNPKDMDQRKAILNDIVKKAEDFLINDFSDIASMKRIAELSKDIDAERVKELADKADTIKKRSNVLANRARIVEKDHGTLDTAELQYLREAIEHADKQIYGEQVSSALNQAKIDDVISKYKKDLNPKEAELFDAMMLGTLWRGRNYDINKTYDYMKSKNKKLTPEVKSQIEEWMESSKKTSLSRVGYASEAVSDYSVKAMLKEYDSLFNKSIDKVDPDLAKKAKKIADEVDLDNEPIDPITKKRMDELDPFIGLKKGKLGKEEAELYLSLKEHLNHYNDVTSKDLNGVMRFLLNKDLNAASLEDFRTLDRWFRMTRDGTWWQKIMRPVKDKAAKITGWHWLMFPKAVGNDLLRYDLGLMDARAKYKTKDQVWTNEWTTGTARVPTDVIHKNQAAVHTLTQHGTQMYEQQKREYDDDFRPFLEGLSNGDVFYRISVRKQENKYEPDRILEDDPIGGRLKAQEYRDQWKKIQKEVNWDSLQNETFSVTRQGRTERMTGREIVKEIDKLREKWNERVHGWLSGEKNEFGKGKFVEDLKSKEVEDRYESDYFAVEDFIKKIDKFILDGKLSDFTKEGIDGLRYLARSQMIAYYPKAKEEVKKAIREGVQLETTGKLDFRGFHPHLQGDRKIAAKGLEKYIEEISKDTDLTKEERSKALSSAIVQYKQITGEWIDSAQIFDKALLVDDVYQKLADKKITKEGILPMFTSNPKIRSQNSRKAHIPGWSVEPEIFPQYMKGAIDNIYKHAAQLKGRHDIYKFHTDHIKKHGDAKLTQGWVNFYNLYLQDALGYPQHIPPDILNDPNMKIKGTPYGWFNDGVVKDRFNFIRSKLGIGKQKDAHVPEELRGINFGHLARMSNMEAKWQLASLLAHPKSAVTNLYGGTLHTIVNTGMKNYLKGRSPSYLKTINPEWDSLQKVQEWVQSLGVVEDFILYEAGLSPQFKSKRFKNFLTDATAAIKRDPQLSDKNLKNIAKKHGIIDSVFNKAAWFMRRPERTLRRDAFMAHYIQARDNFQGGITRFDDPILIKMGMEGVKSTQFLYSAPFRPAFARSSMGKVVTRFQLWAWNSVRFRNEIMKEARLRGWKEGTVEFERYKRMATMDLLVWGLANTFMYSLFENALPQPYAWMQDFADWAFGNENEKNRAFYGNYPGAFAPLQLITPPSLRGLGPMFKWMVNDDSATQSNYILWSLFPFGRMMRDIAGEGGLIENPSRIIEKTTGIPWQDMSRKIPKYKDDEMLYPKVW